MGRWVRVFCVLVFGLCSVPTLAQEVAPLFAFAKASPLVAWQKDKTDSKPQAFAFAQPYRVLSQDRLSVQVDVDGTFVNVSRAQVVLSPDPHYVVGSDGFSSGERASIRFWDSNLSLTHFLAGSKLVDTKPLYDELIVGRNKFALKLPILAYDAVDIFDGQRQAEIVNVLVPIGREAFETYEEILSGNEVQVSLSVLVDMSGSADGFVQDALRDLADAINRDPMLGPKVELVRLVTFGEPKSRPRTVGMVDLPKLGSFASATHRASAGGPDQEPLIDGLLAASSAIKKAEGLASVLVVLSGADVQPHEFVDGKTIEVIDIDRLADAMTIFAQITPEPSQGLETASRETRGSGRYVPFAQEGLGERIVSHIREYLKTVADTNLDRKIFSPVAAISQSQGMLAMLPMELAPGNHLPPPPSFGEDADWYAVNLWVTVDDLVLKIVNGIPSGPPTGP